METLDHYLDFAKATALEAGKVLEKYWGRLTDIQEKTFSGDLVTEADKEAEIIILDRIRENYPDHHIIAEESGRFEAESSEYTWYVDPLDGTTNYTHQFPIVAVSIGLVRNNTPVVGVIYNPILNELYQASKGSGAKLNGTPISVSNVTSLNKSLLATGFAYDRRETEDNNYLEFCHMTNLSQGVRRAGAAALDLAFVASGRLDGFWERGLNPWDIAAGIVLVEEAGGQVTSYEGEELIMESGRLLASNGKIHKTMIKELQDVRSSKDIDKLLP